MYDSLEQRHTTHCTNACRVQVFNKSLQTLNLCHDHISDAEVVKSLFDVVLHQLPSLETFNELNLPSLRDGNVTELDLGEKGIGDSGVLVLCELLLKPTQDEAGNWVREPCTHVSHYISFNRVPRQLVDMVREQKAICLYHSMLNCHGFG